MSRSSELFETVKITCSALFHGRYVLTIACCIGMLVFFNSEAQVAKNAVGLISSWVRNSYVLLTRPLVTGMGALEEALSYIANIGDNKKLRSEIDQLIAENAKLRIEVDESMRLKQQLNFFEPLKKQKITTRVFAANSDGASKTFFLDVGSSVGIKAGDIACNNNVLIGKVVNAYKNTSVVQSVIDNNSKIPAIASKGNQKMIVIGNGSANNLSIKMHNSIEVPEDGDLVVTSGDGGVYPYGLIIGRLKLNGEHIVVEPDPVIKDISYVTVILN